MTVTCISHKSFKVLTVFAVLLSLFAKLPAQTDTAYVKKYYNNLVPRLLTNYKVQATSFATKSDTLYSVDYFTTGAQNFIGAEVSYKWATLGYNFGFNKENSSANTDLRFSASYKPLRLQANYSSLKSLNYYRINGNDQKDTLFKTPQHNIELRNVGLKVDYIFNYKSFYYASSISQAGQQLKSKGSFILSAGVSYQDFNLRGLSDSISLQFLNRYRIDDFRTGRLDAGLGYAYNWVITRHLAFYFSDIPNLGFQQITTSENKAYTKHHTTVSITNYVRAGVLYTWQKLFVGLYAYNAVTASRWDVYRYTNVYTSLQLHVGLVLNDPRNWKKKN